MQRVGRGIFLPPLLEQSDEDDPEATIDEKKSFEVQVNGCRISRSLSKVDIEQDLAGQIWEKFSHNLIIQEEKAIAFVAEKGASMLSDMIINVTRPFPLIKYSVLYTPSPHLFIFRCFAPSGTPETSLPFIGNDIWKLEPVGTILLLHYIFDHSLRQADLGTARQE